MAEQNNLIRDAVTRIPVWNGDGKDAFTAEQWLVRIEKARQAAAWDDANTMSFIYCSLRGEALLWYDVLKRSGIEDNFAAFRTAFLTSYAPALTARTATVNLHDVKQNSQESIVQFYSRVIKAVNDLEALLPAAQRANAATYPAAVIALAGYNAIPAADRRAGVQHLLDTGITTAMNHIGLQLFVAGLRSSIRDELMKNMPASLWEAFQNAVSLEKISASTKTSSTFPTVNEIATEEQDEALELEIDAVSAQLARLRSRKTGGFQPRQNNGGRPGGAPSKGSGNYDPKTVICRCCKKKGHFQDVCYTRIKKGLPCVDAKGVPLSKQPPSQGRVNEISDQSGSPMAPISQMPQNFAPPPQQGGFWTPYPPNFQ